MSSSERASRRASLAALAALALGACGFRLRGDAEFAFSTLYISTDTNTPFYAELKRTLTSSARVRILPTAAGAEAILELTPPNPIDDKSILTLSGGGRVREFQLTKRVIFRIHDGRGGEWLPPAEVTIRRDFSFNDSQALAKESEERMLLLDMQTDAIHQMVRRMQTSRRPPA